MAALFMQAVWSGKRECQITDRSLLDGVATGMKIRWGLAVIGVLLLGLGAFYIDLLSAAFAKNPFPQSVASIDRGRLLFQKYCAVCHGPEGRGDGVVALAERPDDLTTIAKPPMFPDGIVAYRIANGINLMPAWKDTLRGNDIWDLINFIRSMQPSGARSP